MDKLIVACSLLALSGACQAATQTWDFVGSGGSGSISRNIIPNTVNLSDDDNSMSVSMTAWSAYNPGDYGTNETIFQAELWLSQWGTLVFNSSSDQHYVDNLGRYDFILLSFSEEVELAGISVAYADQGSDISIAAFNNNPFTAGSRMQRWNEVSSYAVASSSFSNVGASPANHYYSLNTASKLNNGISGVASKYWMIGAYNEFFGSGLTAGNDHLKFSGLTTNTTTPRNEISEPVSLSLFAMALLVLAGRRKFS
ncbi:exosortase-dependent surface protein XDP1 [Rheinheimera gaetbuli]